MFSFKTSPWFTLFLQTITLLAELGNYEPPNFSLFNRLNITNQTVLEKLPQEAIQLEKVSMEAVKALRLW